MKREIEAKMRLRDIPAIEAKLAGLGASLSRVMTEVNTYFDTPQGSLKASDQGLRMRVTRDEVGGDSGVDTGGDTGGDSGGGSGGGDEISITHKGPRALGELKDRPETHLGVSDAESADELLTALGYVRVLTFEKHRRRWVMDNCLVELDTVACLGDFIEIEGPSEKAVLETRRRLGLEEIPLIQHSYISMLKTYLTEHQITDMYIGMDREIAGA